MPGNYTLELELFSLLNASVSGFEIWGDGALLGGYSSTVSSSGSTISITVPYGGALPTSLEFRFNDTVPGTPDTIEIRSVIINDRYVNTGNYLSTNTLNDGGSSTVAINTSSDFLFDDSPPPGATFTTGATQTFTTGNDFYQDVSNTTPQVFDMLGGRDVAYLGTGDDTVSGGAGNDILYGGGGADLIYGDLGDDLIKGGIGNDTLFGGDGDDRIHGEDGDDEIHGGDGADRLHGHSGADIITGGAGADVISGGADNDVLFGDGGDDQLIGGTGDDTLDGGGGDDTLYGGAGIDHLNGGAGNDTLVGNAGNDVMHGDDGRDLLISGIGDDTVFGGAGNDTLFGQDGDDTLDGGAGEDEIFGGNGIDDINAGSGHDIIRGGDAGDTINTGDGDDIVFADGGASAQGWIYKYYDLTTSPTTLATAGFSENGGIDSALDATSQGITEVFDPNVFDTGDNYALKYETYLTITIAGNYTFRTRSDDGSALFLDGVQIVDNDGLHSPTTVTSAAQTLAAGVYKLDATFFERTGGNVMEIDMSGPDTGSVFVSLENYAGVNPANGDGSVASGDDIIDTGAGNDTIFGDQGVDTIDAGDNDDLIFLANGDFAAGESIDGGNDTDELILSNATTVDFTTGTLANLETLTGSGGNDDVTYAITTALDFTTIDLGAGTDNSRVNISGTVDATVLGTPTVLNAENGFLTGSTGNDDLTITGAQLDALVYGSGIIDFAAGTDVLRLTSTSTNLNTLGATDAFIQGLEEVNASTAGSAVTIDLNAQTEDFSVVASSNGDTITTGSGADTITGGAGNDIIDGGSGDNYIIGGDGDDNITTQAGDDDLYGGAGADTINGGAGNDTIIGDGSFIDTSSLITYDPIQDGGGTATQLGNGVNLDLNNWKRILVNYNVTANTVLEFDLRVTTANEIHAIGFDNDTNQSNSTSQQFQLFGDGSQTYGQQAFRTYTGSGDYEHFSIDVGTYYTGFFSHLTLISDDDNAPINSNADFINIIIYESDGSGVAGDGADILTGGAGSDTIIAGGGNDIINLANGDFAVGENIDGGSDTDTLTFTNATTVDFTTGTVTNVETLTGSGSNDDVTYTIQQALGFSTINLGGGTDNSRVLTAGVVDVTALGTPTVTNTENGFLTGSTGNDDVTITGAQLNRLIFGGGTINFDTGADILNLTSTSTNLNTLGNTDGDILGLETISATGAGAGVAISVTGQTEGFTVIGSGFNDSLNTGAGNDIVSGGAGDDVINGGNGDDILDGGADNDTLVGGNGDDTLIDSGGDDIYNGQGNIDTLTYASAGGAVTVDLSITVAQNTINAGIDTITNVENLVGSDFNDTLSGNNSANTIDGGLGDDTIRGAGGDDILNGEDGNDIFQVSGTEARNDIFNGGIGTDVIRNISGAAINFNSAIVFNSIEEIDGNNQRIQLDGTTTIDFSGIITSTNVTEIRGSGGIDNITGTQDDDVINGNNGNDIINGGTGNDTINGQNNDDVINGGIGNDNLRGGAGTDIVNGDAGNDILELAGNEGRDDTFDGGADYDILRNVTTGNVTLNGSTVFISIEEIDGNGQNIVIDANETIDFSSIVTSTNVNEIQGNNGGSETITGTQDDDVINGRDGDDVLNGGSGNDTLRSGNGNDILNGGIGNDILRPDGTGTVTLNGDAGNDIFEVAGGQGRDDTFNGGADYDIIRNINAGTMTFNSGTNFINVEEIDGNNQRIQVDLGTVIDFSSITTSTNVTEIRGNNTAGPGETITGTQDNDFINGQDGDDIINGDLGDDILWSGNGADILNGGIGNDTLRGNGTGANILNGDAGNDIFDVRGVEGRDNTFNGGADYDILRNTTTNQITFNSGSTFSGIEEIDGNSQRINIDAGSTVDFSSITTSTNVTEIRGQNGTSETITGTQDDDVIDGRSGDDTLYGDLGADTINGGDGNDRLYGDPGTIGFSGGLLVIEAEDYESKIDRGSQGWTTVTDGAASGGEVMTALPNSGIIYNTTGIEDASPELTYTVDFATTGTFYVWIKAGVASGGANDSVHLGFDGVQQTGAGGVQTGSNYGWHNTETGTGTVVTVNVTTVGTHTLNLWMREDGAPIDKIIIADTPGFTPIGNGPDAPIRTSTSGGNDILNGGNGDDILYGDFGDDTLNGGNNDDTLYGGDGLDALTGGAGADTFVFENTTAFNDIDTVSDFNTGQNDALDISDILSASGYIFGTSDITDFVQILDNGANSDVYIDVDGLGVFNPADQMATLLGVTGLTDELALETAGNLITT